jgi:translation initiation factor 2B subunit (eIF-2B alpha/beta/delta family)
MSGKITLNSIINDKVSGSSEILERLNKYILQNTDDIHRLRKDIHGIKKTFTGFAAIDSYIKQVETLISSRDSKKLNTFLNRFNTGKNAAYERIFKNTKAYLPNLSTVLTLSNSKTLLEIFKSWSGENKKLNFIVCESRPKNEGVIFAQSLAEENIKVSLITDASMSNYIAKADAVIVGADIILKSGNVVNKTGSRNAAIICRHFKKPFIVLATKDKFANKKSYKSIQENPGEILSSSHKNIMVSNYYFEEIEKSLITRIITD